jgi:rod shape-determining protein MreC
MLGGLILLFAPRSITGKLQLGFERIFRWPLSVGRDFALAASSEQMLGDTVPRVEYEKLENHIHNLEATLRRERERYKKLYGLYTDPVWEDTDFALAEVITENAEGIRNELTIEYSRDVALVKGQYVLNNNCVIGRISDASAGTAHVRLFTDSQSKIPVKVGELDGPRLLMGNGDGSATVPLVSTDKRVKVGDAVFASDVGTRFLDAPVILGEVSRCVESRENPLLWDITVEPACDLDDLVDVAVIINKPQQ